MSITRSLTSLFHHRGIGGASEKNRQVRRLTTLLTWTCLLIFAAPTPPGPPFSLHEVIMLIREGLAICLPGSSMSSKPCSGFAVLCRIGSPFARTWSTTYTLPYRRPITASGSHTCATIALVGSLWDAGYRCAIAYSCLVVLSKPPRRSYLLAAGPRTVFPQLVMFYKYK